MWKEVFQISQFPCTMKHTSIFITSVLLGCPDDELRKNQNMQPVIFLLH